MVIPDTELAQVLDRAIAVRGALFDARHESVFRLFNGFFEGCPELAIDVYARTIVMHNYASPPQAAAALVAAAQQLLRERLPWLRAVVVKARKGGTAHERNGVVVYGAETDTRVREHGVWYAVDLLASRDTGFYPDTRNLRLWALQSLKGKTVLNAFAYTGSLGVAAQAGGAARVVQLDRNRGFLNVARRSYTLNGLPINKGDFQAGDFWPLISRYKRSGESFDCVFLDPPFYTATKKGVLDLARDTKRLINKVRPIVRHGGYLVAVNNALYLEGTAYMASLEELCGDGYLSLERLIPVPPDFTGYAETRATAPFIDPAPFNHSTKIALLNVRHKMHTEDRQL